MKSIVILIALAALGIVPAAHAQSDKNPAATQAPAAQAPSSGSSGSASGSVSTPGGEVKGQVDVDRKSEARPPARTDSSRDDGGASALPRTVVTERSTIFGLSPTAAVVIAASLLVVVILAIVAMTRTHDTYIDTNRHI
jgi:hypothetical protein